MRIIKYENDTIEFYCDKCNFRGQLGILYLLSDNCVLDVDVICDLCGDLIVLYVVKCKDPALAKALNAGVQALKVKRAAEDKEDDH